LSELTNPLQRQKNKHALINGVSAGSGTILLIIAENLPDHYWFKSCFIFSAPTLSVYLSSVSSTAVRYYKSVIGHIDTLYIERKAERRIKVLRKLAYVPGDDIRALEAMLASVKVKNAERIILKLKKKKV